MTFDLLTIDWGAISALSTITIAGVGFSINRKLRLANERSETHEILVEFRHEIIDFSSEFLKLTSLAIAECDIENGEDYDECNRRRIASDLSALVDKGRFIFPNYRDETDFGKEKGPAFEGFRREQLDGILAAHFAIESICRSKDSRLLLSLSHRELVQAGQPFSPDFEPWSAKSCLVEARRSYLNSVFHSTSPRKWRSALAELLGPMDPTTEKEIDEILAAKGW